MLTYSLLQESYKKIIGIISISQKKNIGTEIRKKIPSVINRDKCIYVYVSVSVLRVLEKENFVVL